MEIISKPYLSLLTDGDCCISDSWVQKFNQLKKEKSFSVISIQIGSNQRTLEMFSDKVVNANDFFDEKVSDAAFTI